MHIAHDLHARLSLSVLPHNPARRRLLPFSGTALLPPSRASALHASQEAHSVIDTSTLFHFRCATQFSSAPRLCAQFSVYRDVNGVRGRAGAYMDLDEVSVLGRLFASSPFSLVLIYSLLTYTPSHRPLFLASFPRARPPHFSTRP
jgi:hypothetical protein